VQWNAAAGSTREQLWLGGRRRKAGTTAWSATMERRDATGKAQTTWVAKAGGPTTLHDIALSGGLGVYAVGASATGPWMGQLGKWELTPTSGNGPVLTGVAYSARGARVLGVGTAKAASSIAYGWLVCARTSGKLDWTKNVVKSLQTRYLVDAVADGEGFLVAGWEQTKAFSSGRRLWVARFAVDGTQLWAKQLPLAGGPKVTFIGALAKVTDRFGGVVIGGGTPTGVGAGWLARVSASGALLWSRELKFDTQFANRVRGIVVQPGGVITTAVETGAGDLRVRVATFNAADGAQRSVRLLPNGAGGERTRDLAKLPHGDVAVIGWRQAKSTPAVGQVLRLDAWGHENCAAAGSCSGTPLCADGDACTVDACTAKTGCSHAPIAGCP